MSELHPVQTNSRRRKILVVEDERVNREMLGAVLGEQFEVLMAENGRQALGILETEGEGLSLVLLDLNLPDTHGFEILRQVKADPDNARVPIIVLTSDLESEAECLTMGAIDFISKPYPLPAVILARVWRIIELFEGRDIIRQTKRDSLTGLTNREYFFRYAEQMDAGHRETAMDAAVVDVCHFHMINERFGRAYGDEVLRQIGSRLLDLEQKSGGIAGRWERDTFLLYIPHGQDYTAVLDELTPELKGRIRLRMGVYAEADKGLDMEQRFECARMAANTVHSSFSRVALYDNALHESELFAEQLLEDFPRAIQEHQFTVFYQPKYDIRPEAPFLNSAEALVRWVHPQLGMISPGTFIPLFESNGLIRQLDRYVWETVCAQMQDWKARLGIRVPVSVNVSRVDMLDTDLAADLGALVKQYGLEPGELLLEITESAYTQDSDQMINTVNQLRSAGFVIEMDDFGSGYSSLSMLTRLPVDAIKLDMQFVRNAFRGRKDTRLLQVVIEIAQALGVPTIAEGVETAEQMFSLKAIGCDIVQGYYFSRPVPAPEFEAFLEARKKAVIGPAEKKTVERTWKSSDKLTYDALHDPETGLYNYSAFEMLLRDADPEHIALILLNLDDFGALQKTVGHDTAERLCERVADLLRACFRSVDYVCRISRDEFAVIVTRVNSTVSPLLQEKIENMNQQLAEPADDLPAISLSAGIAFADRMNPQGDIFHDADAVLMHMRENGKRGCAVFGTPKSGLKQLDL
ncbi:MAG: EAL domain-containing protein [Clostridia bacterium]|nr:EAL domain-containing protein [Clostridia bacterium]